MIQTKQYIYTVNVGITELANPNSMKIGECKCACPTWDRILDNRKMPERIGMTFIELPSKNKVKVSIATACRRNCSVVFRKFRFGMPTTSSVPPFTESCTFEFPREWPVAKMPIMMENEDINRQQIAKPILSVSSVTLEVSKGRNRYHKTNKAAVTSAGTT